MSKNLILIPKGGQTEPSMTDTEAGVHIKRVWSHPKYGRKLGIDLPPLWEDEDAKEHFKNGLSYDAYHRRWNKPAGEWAADLKALNLVIDVMTDAGYDVTVPVEVAREYEEAGYIFLPKFRKAKA